MRYGTDDEPDRGAFGASMESMMRPMAVRDDRQVLEELVAAVRAAVRDDLPALERWIRSTDRREALDRSAGLRRRLWDAAEIAARRAGLEAAQEPAEDRPKTGRWAW
jgi:hypothetical protein